MPAFRVPSDLATLDLTLAQVREILDNRRKRKLVESRLEGLPAKEKHYLNEIERHDIIEADLLKSTEDEASK